MFDIPDNTQSLAALGRTDRPALNFLEDLNTGIDSFAADTLSIVGGGVKGFTFTPSAASGTLNFEGTGGFIIQGNGTNSFLCKNNATTIWTDAPTTTTFQVGANTGNCAFSAGAASAFGRLIFPASFIQWSKAASSSTVIPVDYFEMRTGGASVALVLAITDKGNIKSTPSANTPFLTCTGHTQTLTNALSLVDLAGTWTGTGVRTAIKLNITNTATGAGSLLMDLQAGAVSQFSVTPAGIVTAPTFVSTAVVRLKGYTVATLPAGTVGDTAYATDLLAPGFLVAAVGGGAVVGPVFFNGAAWVAF